MIDPRALQQHFNNVRQKNQLQRQPIPRVPDPKSLTAIQAIPVIEPVVKETMQPLVIEPIVLEPVQILQPSIDTSELQKELSEVTQALTTLKQSLTQTPQIEPVTNTAPVSVVTEIKQETTQTEPTNIELPKDEIPEEETPYGYTNPKISKDPEEYNPYGYYSGPRF